METQQKPDLEKIGTDILNGVHKNALSEWKPKTLFGRIAKFIATAITPKDVYNIVVKK